MSDLALAAFASETGTHLVRPPASGRWREFLRRFDERAYRERLALAGHRFAGRSSPEFPRLLGAIHDPPPGIFLRGDGDLELLSRPSVAIVGARACSGYGAAVARGLGRDLAAAGLVVVSGLARGIDAEAHRGALEAGGATVAVLGCGIDRDYPAAHAELARRVAAAGLIVSEYAPGVEPAPWRFPARNRIVAGLCAATVVVEARERSGALITADLALEEGREVLAVPGEITSSLSAGTNALLKLGAGVLTAAGDILASFGIDPEPSASAPVSEAAASLLDLVREAPAGADVLARRSGLAAGEVARALVELELAGLVSAGDGLYRPLAS
ncbi:MAG TPA: DNA-processing protein DprA [Gaiellaceae bacterium]|jgi:DNA processing protein|nr:DNA-processing protein DprA [Gaiellaceae bacterium]